MAATPSDAAGAAGDLLETWEDYLLSDVFGVSLSARVARVKESLHMRTLEEELREETAAAPRPQLAASGLVDRVLVTRLSSHPPQSGVVGYLLRAYEAAVRAGSAPLRGKQAAKEEMRQTVLGGARDAVVTYFALTALNPGMWSAESEVDGMDAFVATLENPGHTPIPRGFVDHLVRHLQENEELGAFAAAVADAVSGNVSRVVERYQGGLPAAAALLPMLTALTTLAGQRELCSAMAQTPPFQTAAELQGSTVFSGHLVGKFLSYGLGKEAFVARDGVNLVEAYLETAPAEDLPYPQLVKLGEVMQTARKAQAQAGVALHGVVRSLLKDPDLRSGILSWIGSVCDLNLERLKTGVQHGMARADVSKDLHLFHLLDLLLHLCEPFANLETDKGKKLAQKVDLGFVTSELRFSIAKDDRLAMSGANLDRWLDERNLARIQQFQAREAADRAAAAPSSPGSPMATESEAKDEAKTFGTVSEFLGLCGRICHLCVIPAIAQYTRVDRLIEDYKKEKQRLEEMVNMIGGVHQMRARMRLAHVATQLEAKVLWRLEMNTVLFDPELLTRLHGFLRLQGYSLCRLVAAESAFASDRITTLPLPAPAPASLYAALPAHLLEDIAEVLTFTTMALAPHPRTHRNIVDDLPRGAKEDFLELIVAFSGSPTHVRNPYLRAKLIEALVGLTPTDSKRRGGATELQAIFETTELAREHLAPILLRFFVDIEFTGSHTQFYDKFRYRSLAARIMAFLWTMPAYRTTVVRASQDLEFFVGFINMIINDIIYHMDDALTKLREVREVQAHLADPTHDWGPPEENRRAAQESILEQNSSLARYSLREAMQLVHMLSYLSAEPEIRAPFMTDDMRGRIAEMLNYFLTYLAGPKAKELNVDNKEELGFRPLEVLANLATVYTNFAACEGFLASVAADQRSYSPAYLQKAIRLLRKHGGVSQAVLTDFEALAANVAVEAETLTAEEEDLGEVPEDFLDPLTYDLMRDPVRLPTSSMTVDRPNIKRHLLSDHTDPFNRQHLTLEMLEPDVELKARIDAWRAERRTAAKPSAPDAGSGPPVPAAAED